MPFNVIIWWRKKQQYSLSLFQNHNTPSSSNFQMPVIYDIDMVSNVILDL